MGCDIHLYLERKNKEGTWEPINVPENLLPDDRCYALFGLLAGVRSDEFEPLFKDRGIPEDTCYKKSKGPGNDDMPWLGDHSFTYAYLDEIYNIEWPVIDEWSLENCYFNLFFSHVLPRLISFYGYYDNREARNIRVVMGFDN